MIRVKEIHFWINGKRVRTRTHERTRSRRLMNAQNDCAELAENTLCVMTHHMVRREAPSVSSLQQLWT